MRPLLRGFEYLDVRLHYEFSCNFLGSKMRRISFHFQSFLPLHFLGFGSVQEKALRLRYEQELQRIFQRSPNTDVPEADLQVEGLGQFSN